MNDLTKQSDNHNHAQIGLPDECTRVILRERALRLAAPFPSDGVSYDRLEIVVFMLQDETYAIESQYIKETVVVKSITPLPGVPDFIAGITSLRGDVVSVVDLRSIFDIDGARPAELYMLYLQYEEMAFGVLADTILGVREIGSAELQSNIATLTGARSRYVRGITSDSIAVLDARVLLTDDRLVVRDA